MKKKSREAYNYTIILLCLMIFLAGCSRSRSAESEVNEDIAVSEINEDNKAIEDDEISKGNEEIKAIEENDISEDNKENKVSETNEISVNESRDYNTIVWIGDSLTQGSLGDDNDNVENAPYVKLQELAPENKVEGYGYFAFNTHDALWLYGEDHKKDSESVYIFWCGSNDWAKDGVISTEMDHVIPEIDLFLWNGKIDKYIVIGQTKSASMRGGVDGTETYYKTVNDQLYEYYGDHFLNIADLISIETGFGPDNGHLTQESYDLVAEAVYEKLKEMNYLYN